MDISLTELTQLIMNAESGSQTKSADCDKINYGFCIVVSIERFIHAGELSFDNGLFYIKNPISIRYWASESDGLGQLAIDGPVESTITNQSPDITGMAISVMHWVPSDATLWSGRRL